MIDYPKILFKLDIRPYHWRFISKTSSYRRSSMRFRSAGYSRSRYVFATIEITWACYKEASLAHQSCVVDRSTILPRKHKLLCGNSFFFFAEPFDWGNGASLAWQMGNINLKNDRPLILSFETQRNTPHYVTNGYETEKVFLWYIQSPVEQRLTGYKDSATKLFE